MAASKVTFQSVTPPKSTRGRHSSVDEATLNALASLLMDSDEWQGSSERFKTIKEARNRVSAYKRGLEDLVAVNTRVYQDGDGFAIALRAKSEESEG